MKTTPNPKATKNSNGELVAPDCGLLLLSPPVLKGEGTGDVGEGSDVAEVALLRTLVVALLRALVALLSTLVGPLGVDVGPGSAACRMTALTTARAP